MSKNILLGVTGSVATTVVHKMIAKLLGAGHNVHMITTEKSFYFWEQSKIDPRVRIWTEKDEWPGDLYVKDQEVPHIALGDWADLLLVAPLSANTMAKMANGICDNLLTSTVRAWPPEKPMVLAPAMNTRMWQHPITVIHCMILHQWHYHTMIIDPVEKRLACGDYGIGAMAHVDDICQQVMNLLK